VDDVDILPAGGIRGLTTITVQEAVRFLTACHLVGSGKQPLAVGTAKNALTAERIGADVVVALGRREGRGLQ
jgi:hypothetical protein